MGAHDPNHNGIGAHSCRVQTSLVQSHLPHEVCAASSESHTKTSVQIRRLSSHQRFVCSRVDCISYNRCLDQEGKEGTLAQKDHTFLRSISLLAQFSENAPEEVFDIPCSCRITAEGGPHSLPATARTCTSSMCAGKGMSILRNHIKIVDTRLDSRSTSFRTAKCAPS